MKTRRFCPQCGRPLCKSSQKGFDFQCYNCGKDFTKIEVLRKVDLLQVKALRHRSYLDDLWRGEYAHSHKRPFPGRGKAYVRSKAQVPKYTANSLIAINGSYHYEHGIKQSDVDMANRYVQMIENTRSDKQPRNGDMIRLTTQHGDYYPYAHLEKLYEDGFSVCEQPYFPFIYPHPTKNGISCSTSGGAWLSIPPKALKYVGKEEKFFKDWGWCGARGNGAVCFKAEVCVWEYIAPNPVYDNYTTKNWRKVHLSKDVTSKKSEYLYSGNGMAFKTQQELDEYISLFRGKLYSVYWPNSFVLWCYFEKEIKLSENAWKALDLPRITFKAEASYPVKMEMDKYNHTVTRYTIKKSKLQKTIYYEPN